MRRLISSHCVFYLARSFISAVLIIYLLGKGIPLSTIAFAKSTQLAVSIAFNVVGGRMSDRFGNKVCTLLACTSSFLYFLLMVEPTAIKVIVGEALNGLAIALYKGAYESWSFKFISSKEPVVSVIFRSNEAMFGAMMLAGVLGALFAPQALIASLFAAAVAFLLFSITPEPRNIPPRTTIAGRRRISTELRNLNVFFYVLAAGLTQLIYQYWPIYLLQASNQTITQEEVGWAFGACMCVQTLTARYVRKQNFLSKDVLTRWAIAILLLSCIGVGVAPDFVPGRTTAVTSYILFATAGGLYLGLLFAKVCEQFSRTGNEGQLISWVDALGRGAGACILALWGVFDQVRVGLAWAILFGASVLAYLWMGRMRGTNPPYAVNLSEE